MGVWAKAPSNVKGSCPESSYSKNVLQRWRIDIQVFSLNYSQQIKKICPAHAFLVELK